MLEMSSLIAVMPYLADLSWKMSSALIFPGSMKWFMPAMPRSGSNRHTATHDPSRVPMISSSDEM